MYSRQEFYPPPSPPPLLQNVGYHIHCIVLITRDALGATRVKKRVGYLCRRVFIFLRRSHK